MSHGAETMKNMTLTLNLGGAAEAATPGTEVLGANFPGVTLLLARPAILPAVEISGAD